jgi:hypothetical protein
MFPVYPRESSLFFPPHLPAFSPNPFADVRRTILELDVSRLAASQKLNSIAVYERYVLQIQGDVAAGFFQFKEPAQFVNIPSLDSTA